MGQTDRPDDRRAAGSRLPSNSESAVKSNHETPKSGIPKRKKIEACPRLSCKIQYLLASNHSDQSTASEYFTDDYLLASNHSDQSTTSEYFTDDYLNVFRNLNKILRWLHLSAQGTATDRLSYRQR